MLKGKIPALVVKYVFLGCVFGLIYTIIELLYDGSTHISMFFAGMISGILIGLINEYLSWETPLVLQMLIGGIIVTIVELIFGIVLKYILHIEVWDYSNMPFNFLGIICLPFSCIWVLLSLVGILLDDWLRYLFFDEEYPHYKIF